MSDTQPPRRIVVSQWWVDRDGDLTFIITKDGEPYAQGYLSPDGEWAFYFINGTVPSITEQLILKALCARHIISRAFGGE